MDHDKRKLDRTFHDRTAATYDSQVASPYRIYHKIDLRPWVDMLPPMVENSPALDIGTGTGIVASELSARCRNIVALDHSIGMIRTAREKVAGNRLRHQISFAVADCHQLPFSDETFMTVTIQGVLHHFGSVDMKSTLKEISRVMAAGGYLYVSEPCQETSMTGKILDLLLELIKLMLRPDAVFRKMRKGLRNMFSKTEQQAPDEGAINADELLELLFASEIEASHSRLKHIDLVKHLPEKLRIFLTRVVSKLLSSRGGDIIFVYGRKQF